MRGAFMESRYSQVKCGACKTTHDVYVHEPAYPFRKTEFVCPVVGKTVYFTIPETPTDHVDIIPDGAILATPVGDAQA
jgi:hypothetical protein